MAFTAELPPTPRPRAYPAGCWPSRCTATRSGQVRPGSAHAAQKHGPPTEAGVSAEQCSGPASSSSTRRSARSDSRAASTAPALPAPTMITS
jgi:hypothetical protein